MSGIRPKIPHFWLLPSSKLPVVEELFESRCGLLDVMEPVRECVIMLGRSNMCSVDLSDVTARRVLFGDIAIE